MAEVTLTGPGGTEYLCGSDFGYARDRITFSEPRGTVTDTTGSVADLKAAAGDAYSIVMTGGGRLVATDARTCETVAAYTVARLRRMIGGAP